MPWLPTVYIDGMHRIGLGMQYCLEIGRANNTITKMAYQERLRNLCCGLICNTDLHVLLNGIIGDGILQGDIMDELYKRTGGNRARISALGTRMLQLISGGMLVSLTYDTMRFGKEYAAYETGDLYGRLVTARDKVKFVLDRCVENFEGNMRNALRTNLDDG